jgi:hypothetical protein
MRRESVFICSYGEGASEVVARVRAWDGKEAAEVFAREVELDPGGTEVSIAEIRVRSSLRREATASTQPTSGRARFRHSSRGARVR